MAAQRVAKNVFTTVSDSVFPGASKLFEQESTNFFEKGNELLSDLLLQMTLYFNCFYSPLWLASCIVILALKYEHVGPYYKFVLIVVYIVMAFVELLRLYLGYAGNLQEKVPELAGFWLVSLILQLPLTCFLLFNENIKILALERGVNIIMLVFLVIELIQGYRTIKKMTDVQVEKFKLQQLQEPDFEHDDVIENYSSRLMSDTKKFN